MSIALQRMVIDGKRFVLLRETKYETLCRQPGDSTVLPTPNCRRHAESIDSHRGHALGARRAPADPGHDWPPHAASECAADGRGTAAPGRCRQAEGLLRHERLHPRRGGRSHAVASKTTAANDRELTESAQVDQILRKLGGFFSCHR